MESTEHHAFARCNIAVQRCLKIGLYMPEEKTYGHILATLVGRFQMASTSKDCNELLLEFKRLLKRQRGNLKPELREYPADPRALPAHLLAAAYGDVSELDAAILAHDRPGGKWLRCSSKELDGHVRTTSPSQSKTDPLQSVMKMQMELMSMIMAGGSTEPSSGLSNLVLFPQRKKKAEQKALAETAEPEGSPSATPDPKALADGNLESIDGQGSKQLALQDRPVRNADNHSPGGSMFSIPSVSPNKADKDVIEHAAEMKKAFDSRAASKKRPASKMAEEAKEESKGKAAGKGKPKAKPAPKSKALPKSKAECKAHSKPKLEPKGKRPQPIAPGGATCYYLGGKIHRSDASSSWRVFKKSSDRCDVKIHWKGNSTAAWKRALDVIEEANVKK